MKMRHKETGRVVLVSEATEVCRRMDHWPPLACDPFWVPEHLLEMVDEPTEAQRR